MKKIISLIIIGFVLISGCNAIVLGLNPINSNKEFSLSFKEKQENNFCNSFSICRESYFDDPIEEWNKTYGGLQWDIGSGVKITEDGGFILVGTRDAQGYNDGGNFWLVKTDAYGNLEWEKTYGGSNVEQAQDVWYTSDSGFIICGATKSFGVGDFDVWLVKTDIYGNEIWNKTFGGVRTDIGTSVQQTADGGYIICGLTRSYGFSDGDAWLLKTDSQGNLVWDKTFGDEIGGEYLMCVKQTIDGGYIAAGRNYLDNNGNSDGLIIKVDMSGNLEWEKHLSSSHHNGLLGILQTSDAGYILTGQSSQVQNKPEDLSLFKIDSNGIEEWRKYYGDSYFDTGVSVKQTTDGGYIVVGAFSVDSDETMDGVLLKTDSIGNFEWQINFGGSESDECFEVQLTSDGGYIVVGFTNSYSAGNQDAWLIKFTGFENQMPNKPLPPSGSPQGKIGQEYTFTSYGTDPDDDQIYYMFDWGDETNSGYLGPYNSGDNCSAKHIWGTKGSYDIKVKTIDEHNSESPWSEPLQFSLPKNKEIDIPLFLQRFFQHFPFFEKILKQIL